MPPVQRPGGKEAQVLEDVQHAVALGLVVERRHVPQPEDPGVEDHGEHGVGDETGAALDRLDAPGRRAQQRLGQPEDEQDRREVEQQHVLDHVHHHQLIAERVQGRDERDQDGQDPAREQERAPQLGGWRSPRRRARRHAAA